VYHQPITIENKEFDLMPFKSEGSLKTIVEGHISIQVIVILTFS
jgi:hypothetical protein